MDEQRRHQANTELLQKINPHLRPKMAAVLSDLEQHGERPLIDSHVWRSAKEQAEMVARGVSKVLFSYHNCSTPMGFPDSLAADIIDAGLGWDIGQSFWLKLASSADAHGLDWGGYWGLLTHDRVALRNAIIAKEWTRPHLRLGWDTAHVQVRGISLRQAKQGVRP